MDENYYSVFTWRDVGGFVVHRCVLPPPGVLHETIICNFCKREFRSMIKRAELVWYILLEPGIVKYADKNHAIHLPMKQSTIFDEIGNFNDITS